MISKSMNVAFYGRYSSNNQRETSIEDQRRVVTRWAERHGHVIVADFADAAVSGANAKIRQGLQSALRAALSRHRRFDAIAVDQLSRLSRDVGDTDALVKQLRFSGVRVVAVSEGIDTADETTKISVTVKSLVNELYLDDLRKTTKRGMDGQFLKGFSTGGKTFGYRSQPVHDPSGRTDPWGNPVPIGYRLTVVPEEAAIVREIFRLFQEGWGEKAIAKWLNRQHAGRTWRPNTIFFMLKNPKYTGRFSFNRREWRKNPETGRRVYRLRPKEHWETLVVEDLRIVDEQTWLSVTRRLSNRRHLFSNTPRVMYLLSGFLICDRCSGHFTIVSNDHYGCRNHSESNSCDNDLRARRDAMESLVIGKLATRLQAHKAAICQAAVRQEVSQAEPPSTVEPKMTALRKEAAAVMHAVRESRLTGRALDEAMATYQAIWGQIEAAERAAATAADRKPAEVHYDVTVIEDFLTHLPDVLRSDLVLGREFLADALSAVRIAGADKRSLNCPVCARKLGKLTPRHMALHGLSLAETYQQFPEVGFNKKARLTFQPGLLAPLLGREVYTDVAGGGFEPPTFGL